MKMARVIKINDVVEVEPRERADRAEDDVRVTWLCGSVARALVLACVLDARDGTRPARTSSTYGLYGSS